MLKKTSLMAIFLLCLAPFVTVQASIEKEFVQGFINELEKVIAEKRQNNQKYCESFRKHKIYSEFSYADDSGNYLLYYKLGSLRVDHFKDMVSQNFECYGKIMPNQGDSLVGAIFNSRAYNKDLKLVDEALERLAGQKIKGHQTLKMIFDLD